MRVRNNSISSSDALSLIELNGTYVNEAFDVGS